MAKAFGISHAACALAAFLALMAACASTASLVLPWWQGKDAGAVVNVSDHASVGSSISIWSFSLTVRIDQEDGAAKDESTSDSWYNHCNAHDAEVEWIPSQCFKIRLMRASGILSVLFAVLAIGGWIVAILTSPLLAVIGGFFAVMAGLFAFIKMVVGAMIGTAGLTTGGAASLLSLMCSCLGLFVSLYGASKEVKAEAEKEDPRTYTRQAKAAEARLAAIQSYQALNGKSKKKGDDDASEEAKEDEEPPKKIPVYLKKVLCWSSEQEEGAEEEIPVELLEVAFREIDGDGSGCIELDELVDSLHLCGLQASQNATHAVMQEIDKNASGDVDIHEFIEFFRHIEELDKFGKKSAQRAQFATFLLNCCFLTHIVVVGTLLMLFIRMEAPPESDQYIIMQNGLMVTAICLIVLFGCVVALPAGRLTFGPLIAAIRKHYAPKPKWKREKLKEEAGPEVTWKPPLQPAAVHPEMLAKSWRHASRAQQMVDTGFAAYEVRRQESLENPRRNRRGTSDEEMGFAGMGQTASSAGMGHTDSASMPSGKKIDEKTGEVDSYDPNAFKHTELHFINMRPQTTFSALQVRTDIETAMFDASKSATTFHGATSVYDPNQQSGQLQLQGNY